MRLRSLALLPLLASVVAGGLAAPAAASPEERPYIVVLQDSVAHPSDVAAAHRREHGARVTHTYGAALKGYAASLTASAYGEVMRDPRVAYVEADGVAKASEITTQRGATWGLDRIDSRPLVLDGTYTYSDTATAVMAYVVDTGIQADHGDFAGRIAPGVDAIDGDTDPDDCNGHGTHVAGTIGGTLHGVAKGVQLVGVRVLDCQGSGAYSAIIAGLDWIAKDRAGRPAVANMSLGGGGSTALDDAVKRLIASGVTTVVAAGNGNWLGKAQDACGYSPARVTDAITIGATDKTDTKASFSNYGSCVDWFAPGVGITSAWHTGPAATNSISGTSMAAPHVAGAAALHLAQHPAATAAEVTEALRTNTTKSVVKSASTAANHLLYLGTAEQLPAPTTTKSRK